MSRNSDYTTGNLLDYLCNKSFINSLTEIYPGQINTTIPQIISFTRKLEENDVATKFFMAEKQQKTILNFSVDSLIVTE